MQGKFSVIFLFISSVPFISFLSFWYSHDVYLTTFVAVSQSGYSVLILSLCSLCFSVLEVSIAVSSSLEILSSTESGLLISQLQAFFTSVTVFYFQHFFWFFPRIFISHLFHFPSVLAYCLHYQLAPLAYLEKAMATHSTVLAWRIPGTERPGGLAVYEVTQSQTRLKGLSSSSSP